MTTIGLLDHMGYGNLGDAAIQDTIMANIKRRMPDARFVGFSLVPDDTSERHGIPSHPIRWSYPKRRAASDTAGGAVSTVALKSALKKRRAVAVWAKPLADLVREALLWWRSYRAVKSLDLLVISGGGQLGTTWHGHWAHPYTVFKFSLLAKLAGTPVYLFNVGAGPLDHPLASWFARWAVELADYRSFRDRESQDLMRSLGVTASTEVYPDPVYAFEIPDCPTGASAPGTAPRVVGLNPMGFCDPRVWPRRDESVYRAYLDKLTRFSAWLLGHGYDLRLFTTDAGVDRYAIDDLRERLGQALPLAGADRPPSGSARDDVKDVLGDMSTFDFVVTSKFHGIVFAHRLTKPVIALSYHPKMDAAMRAMSQREFCLDIERFDVDELIARFCSLVTERERLRSECAAAVTANATRLSQQYDRLFPPRTSPLTVDRAGMMHATLQSEMGPPA